MKFGKQLLLKSNSQWGEHYLNYKQMKRSIKKAAADLTPESKKELEATVLAELRRVETFYDATFKESAELKAELDQKLSTSLSKRRKSLEGDVLHPPEFLEKLEKLHQNVEALKMFGELNEIAAFRVFKKLDKKCQNQVPEIRATLTPLLKEMSFTKATPLDNLRLEVNKLYFNAMPKAQLPSQRPELVVKPACETVKELDLSSFPVGVTRVFMGLAQDGLSQPIQVPVIVLKGAKMGPVLGITAALHGNELNGIPLIHRLIRETNPDDLSGTLVAVPVANPPGFLRTQRGFSDTADLNRLFPGKKKGTAAQQYCHNLMEKLIKKLDYLIDMHTASTGRVNSLYVRANMQDPVTRKMAFLQNPQIIVHNTSPDGSLRGAAMDCGIKSITVEIGDPQRFHQRFVKSALLGVENIMFSLKMTSGEIEKPDQEPTTCTNSYWIFSQDGGILTVLPETNTWVRKGQVIAEVHSVFGDLVAEYKSPEDGVIVGKSVNPMCNTGDRILHLGVVSGTFAPVSEDGHL